MKKFLLLFSLLPFPLMLWAQDITITEGGVNYYYNITSSTDHTVAVTNNTGKTNNTSSAYTGIIIIPERITYEGTDYTVTSVGQSAFRGCDKLEQVVLPNTIESIDTLAFYTTSTHDGPATVNIPESVKYIHGQAFYGCSEITGGLPDSLKYIGYRAFYQTDLTWVSIPSSVTYIGSLAFQGCKSLEYLEILNGKEPLDVSAPTKDSEIPFYNCTALKQVFYDRELTINASYAPFSRLSSITLLEIGQHISSIPKYLAYNCSGLETVTFDNNNSVAEIGENAFYGCSKLTGIELPSVLTRLEQGLFRNCTALAAIDIPSGVTYLGAYVFDTCSSLTELTIPEGVATIGTAAFENCSSLKKLHLLNPKPVDVVYIDFSSDGDSDYPLVIYVPQDSEEAYESSTWYTNVVGDSRNLGKIIFNSSLVTIDASDALGEGDYASYYHPYALTIPNGVKAYAITSFSSDGTLTMAAITDGVIPQHSAVLLERDASSGTSSYRIYIAEDDTHTAIENNLLYGSEESTTTSVDGVTDGYYFYGLTTKNGENLGFYWGAENGAAFTIPANKAWLALPSAEVANISYLKLKKDGNTTGIESVEAAEATNNGAIYTLQGMRVSDMSQKGVYIVNGKKVLVK